MAVNFVVSPAIQTLICYKYFNKKQSDILSPSSGVCIIVKLLMSVMSSKNYPPTEHHA